MPRSDTGYFTFFLCTGRWPTPAALTAWIDRMLDFVPSRKSARISASSLSGTPAVEGPYVSNGDFLQDSPSNVTITTRMRGGLFDFFLFLEPRRVRPTPDYQLYLQPERAVVSEDPGAARICSLSFSLPAFRALDAGTRERIVSAVERMFIDTNALYAYGRPTPLPISSPYCLVGAGAGSKSFRIIDFDYQGHIEDLYELNWLSPAHVERVREPDRLRELSDTPARILRGSDGTDHGLFIDASRIGSHSQTVVRRCLGDLLRYESPRRSASLLIGRRQLEAVGLPWLERLLPSVELRRFPYDFAELVGIHEAASANPLGFENALESYYRQAHPSSKKRGREYMVEYPGLLEPTHVYYRFPGLDLDDSRAVKLRLADRVDLSSLPVLLILGQGLSASEREQVEQTLGRWQATVQAHPEAYGTVDWKTAPRARDKNGKVCIEGLLDARKLRQEAIHLLVQLLDEIHERKLMVPYLVLGDFPAA
jgi:hypothetical protein